GAPTYDKPPQPLLDAMHVPALPVPLMSPTADRVLLVSWVRFPPMSRVAAPFLGLAGVRVEPRNRSPAAAPGVYTLPVSARDYTLVTVAGGAEVHVALPPGGCARNPVWSADGTRFFFQNVSTDAVELWIGDAAGGQVRRLPAVRLNPMLG